MATFTITTSQNWDELTTKAGADIYNINGGTLTIDQDTRHGLNTTTTTGPANSIVLSPHLGGTLEVDARYVRLIPYDTGTGNVPAGGTVISQGSASGKLICVMSALTAAPTAVGAAMPTSGYIKIKQWNSVAYAAGALTGIGANATGADIVGWISLCNDESGYISGSALGLLRFRGANYAVGTTDGNRATTYQLPTQGEAIYLPGVQVETAVGSGVYEWYPNAGSQTALLANVGIEPERGKVCWIDSTGVLRFGHDGTNSTGGYCPVTGLNIRMPNVYMHSCTTGARATNQVPNVTVGTRFEFAGAYSIVEMDTVFTAWYLNFTEYKTVTINNCGINDYSYLSEIQVSVTITDTLFCHTQAQANYALYVQLCPWAVGTVNNCKFVRYSLASSSQYVAFISRNKNWTFNDCTFMSMINRTATNCGTPTVEYCSNIQFNDCTFLGARPLFTYTHHASITNSTYIDLIAGTTTSANPLYGIDIGNYCTNIIVDGLTFGGLAMVQPYQAAVSVASWCKRIIVRNIGTPSAPLELGALQQDDVAWTRVTTTATVTKVAHGLKTNDNIYVVVSSDVGAITVAAKVVASTPTADTFTFTCTNGGAASGTLSYYPTVSTYAVSAIGTCEDIVVERVYCQHARTGAMYFNNTCKNVQVNSCWGNVTGSPLLMGHDTEHHGIGCPGALTAQGAVLGSHWFDWYQAHPSPNTAGVAWARVTTTATVTSANHGMRTGDRIVVTVSSDTAAIVLGMKSITAVTSGTFTFACLNAGAASGTLTFVPENARIALIPNAPSEKSALRVVTDVGAPIHTYRGTVYFPLIGDQITWEMKDNVIGFGGFPVDEVVMNTGTLTSYHVSYAINTGAGWSSFKNLSFPTSATGSGGSTDMTMLDTSNIGVGDYVFGAGTAPINKVQSITNGTTIVVEKPHTGVLSGTFRFNQLPNEVIDPDVGCKLKIRVKALTNGGTPWSAIYLFTTASAADREAQYPQLPITDNLMPIAVSGMSGGMQRS